MALRHEFIDIVEHLDDRNEFLVSKFKRHQNEIKNGAQVIVREGQVAAFIYRGALADILEPGSYTVNSENLPLLSTLAGWKYGFESPIKSDVYFISTTRTIGLKWGTKQPIPKRDPELGIVRLRAFGSFVIAVDNVTTLLRQLIGTQATIEVSALLDYVRSGISARFADVLGECSDVKAIDLSSVYDELGVTTVDRAQQDLQEIGLRLEKVLVEGITFPDSVSESIDKQGSINSVGDLDRFDQYQRSISMEKAAGASNTVGEFVSLGAAIPLAQKMVQHQESEVKTSRSADLVQEIERLWALFEKGALTKEEFEKAKAKLISS